MKWLSRLAGRLRRRETGLDSEIEFHLQELIEEKIAQGFSSSEARRQAVLEFGGNEQVKEECRDVHRIATVENTRANLKSAFRFIRKSPGFSLTVVLTLALGIGANSAVFSAIDAILLRALPFPDSQQLVVLHQYNARQKPPESFLAPVRLEDWNRLSSAFSDITGYYTEDVSETSGPLPERLHQILVAPRFLRVMGGSPALGRDFTSEEEHFGGPNAILISDAYWRRRFHADPQVLGRRLRIEGYSWSIIGVMPANFAFPSRDADFWSVSPPDGPYGQARESTWFTGVGRLKPGFTVEQGTADLAHVEAQLGRQFPKTDKDMTAEVQPLKNAIVNGSGRSLWLLFGSVSLLLLIACTNIAALLLARTAERVREISIRYSLGASRASIVAQLLTESFVLAAIGSLIGLAVAAATASEFRALAKSLPRAEGISLDWRIVLYTLGCGLVSTLLFGLVPALQATRRSIAGSLASHGRTQVSGRNPLQWILVGVQVMLAVTLLVGAALLLRSFEALGQVSPGFDASHVLTLQISANWGETVNRKALIQRIDKDLDALRAVPGVAAAATSVTLPGIAHEYPSETNIVEGHGSTAKIVSDTKVVSDGYFETMRIPIFAGEGCSANVSWDAAVVNRSFVAAFLRDQTVIGRHFLLPSNSFFGSPAIIGIAGDARENGINHPPVPIVYWCANAPNMAPNFLVRTHGDSAAMATTIRRAIHQIEPGRSVFDIIPLRQQLYDSSSESRLRTLLLSLFALTAILLASIGLYGTLSYLVSMRHREVGLRIALGALPSQILVRFLKQGLTVSVLGCVAGLILAAACSRILAGMLYGISRVDTTSYLGVAVIVMLIAALASVIPAARAARVDPMRALRDE